MRFASLFLATFLTPVCAFAQFGRTGVPFGDQTKVSKQGDTMTGQLTLAGSTLTITGNAFSVGGSTFVVKEGRVGIGTEDPAQKFHISSGAFLLDGLEAELTVEGNIRSKLVALGNLGATHTIFLSSGNVQSFTLTTDLTLDLDGADSGDTIFFKISQDPTGSRTITWDTQVDWEGGTPPTLTTTANAVDTVGCMFDGANYLCVAVALDLK